MMEDFDNQEPDEMGWLVSYADMMTLIACFFILMMAFANYDPVGFNIKAEKLSRHFRKDKYKNSEVKLTQITEEIAKHELKDRTKISMKDSELVIKFSSSVMFDNASATISPDTLVTLDSLIEVVKTTNPNYRILVEGHSDDDLEGSRYDSQWILSSSRAAEVAKRFEYFGFPKEMIVPIGRSDSQKIEKVELNDPDAEQLRKVNRRVVLRLLEPIKPKKVKFGLGVYFKDATEDPSNNPLETDEKNDLKVEED